MTTQRPFFGNFFALFRTHTSHIPKAGAASVSTTAAAAAAAASTAPSLWAAASLSKQLSHSTTTSTASTTDTSKQTTSPRPIAGKSATNYNTAVQERQLHNSLALPLPLPLPLQHSVSPQTHLPRTPSSGSLTTYGPVNRPQPSYPTVQDRHARRRGSDSSCDSGGGGGGGGAAAAGGGFRDVRPPGEKWFIGGITASGEEMYYKLGMVRRERSADRISADQLSL